MLTTRHPVDCAYTRQELEALFRYAREHDVEQGGPYDARSAGCRMAMCPRENTHDDHPQL